MPALEATISQARTRRCFGKVASATRLALAALWRANAYNLLTRGLGRAFYPDEIEIQETRAKHRKLDSQAALPHRARGRAADGLRPQARSLRASRRDHDPGGLSPRPASLRGLRPAMAADRAIRRPPARPSRQKRNFQRASDPG